MNAKLRHPRTVLIAGGSRTPLLDIGTGGRRAAAISRLVVTGLVLLGLVGGGSALGETAGGTIAGSVLTREGVGLPGSSVTVSGPAAASPLRVVAGSRGVFRVSGLRPGSYLVSADSPGFARQTLAPFELAAGESVEVTLTLEVATVKDAVTVVGRAPSDSVEAADIRTSPARDVGEALASTAGVWKLRKGGIANDVVVRGLESRDVNVLIDGQRVYGACPNHMDPPSFHADFAEVERVEVAKGPFDVKNQGSLGGVVNIVTKDPGPGWHANVNAAFGSDGYVNPSATAAFGGSDVSGLVGYSFRSARAYTDGSGRPYTELANYKTGAVDDNAFNLGTAWGKVAFVPGDGKTIELAYTHQNADQVFYPTLQMDSPWDTSDRVNLTYNATRPGSPIGALKVQAYFTQVDHWMTDQFRTSAGMASRGWSMGTMARSRTGGGKVEMGIGEVTAGVEAFQRYWDATTEMAMSKYVPQHSLPAPTTDVVGAYAEWTHPFSAAVSLSAGGRFDRVRSAADAALADTDLYYAYNGTRSTARTNAFPSGYARLVVRPAEGLEISGGIGSTVRVPEGSERYYALRRMGSDWVGNPDLAPSRDTGADVSVSYRRSGLYVGASVFADGVTDFIAINNQPRVNMVPGVMNPAARSYSNVDATLVGGELNAVVTVSDHVFLSGDVSYVRGTQDAVPGRRMFSTNVAEMPAPRGRIAGRYATGRYWIELEGVASAAQDHVNTDLNEQPTPGWRVANVRGSVSLGGLNVTIGVCNVTNRLYYDTLSYQRDPFRTGTKVPEPGRSLFANVGWQL